VPDTEEICTDVDLEGHENKGWWPVISIKLRDKTWHKGEEGCTPHYILWCFYQILDDSPAAWFL
jgi:hypothetical protein